MDYLIGGAVGIFVGGLLSYLYAKSVIADYKKAAGEIKKVI